MGPARSGVGVLAGNYGRAVAHKKEKEGQRSGGVWLCLKTEHAFPSRGENKAKGEGESEPEEGELRVGR